MGDVSLINHKIQLHYIFEDKQSHSMDALERNKAEREFLFATQIISELIDSEATIETEAAKEGGYIEVYLLAGAALHYLAPSINDIITHYFTRNSKSENLDISIKEETLKGLILDNNSKENALKEYETILNDKDVLRHVSNFYKKLNGYKKIESIGIKSVSESPKEYLINRDQFSRYILTDSSEKKTDPNAKIKIVSPVLENGLYKWRGIYEKEDMEFSMGDKDFKTKVVNRGYNFQNGSVITCKLVINSTYDEFGEKKGKTYSVKKVYSYQSKEHETIELTREGYKKECESHEMPLFDVGEQDSKK